MSQPTPRPDVTNLLASTDCSDGGDCCNPSPKQAPARDEQWLQAARWARNLSWLSLAWMTGEGALGLLAGISAGSIALVGWALGSVIEGLAAVIVVWRFSGARMQSETAERRAQQGVAISFFLLAPYIAVEALRALLTGHDSQSSGLGIAVTAASLLVMPLLGRAKHHLGEQLGSDATAGEGTQNLMCAAQAAAILLGLGLTAGFAWSWADPVVALAIAGWAIYEGAEAWRGEACC